MCDISVPLTVISYVERAYTGGIDGNIADWYLTSSYFGLGLQGSATQTLLIDSIDILAS